MALQLQTDMSNDLDSYDDVAQWDLNLPDGKHSVRFVRNKVQNRSYRC